MARKRTSKPIADHVAETNPPSESSKIELTLSPEQAQELDELHASGALRGLGVTDVRKPTAADTPMPDKDVFDEAAAAHRDGRFEPPVGAVASAATAPATPDAASGHAAREEARRLHGEPKDGVTKEQYQPNPFSGDQIAVTPGHKGQQMRFYRARTNRRLGILEDINAIQFDVKPDAEFLKQLRDNGWRYIMEHKVWKKPLGENCVSEEYANHKFFVELGNAIRERSGMEPVVSLGNART